MMKMMKKMVLFWVAQKNSDAHSLTGCNSHLHVWTELSSSNWTDHLLAVFFFLFLLLFFTLPHFFLFYSVIFKAVSLTAVA